MGLLLVGYWIHPGTALSPGELSLQEGGRPEGRSISQDKQQLTRLVSSCPGNFQGVPAVSPLADSVTSRPVSFYHPRKREPQAGMASIRSACGHICEGFSCFTSCFLCPVGGALPRHGGLGHVQKLAQQARGNKPTGTILHWSLLQFLP